ncbi:MAG: acyl-CoA reductase [Cytophagales bacterium]|nr:acyl-CoA reductase [Cytophagales bacterium]
MELIQILNSFVALGEKLKNLEATQKEEWVYHTRGFNKWFDEKSIDQALEGIVILLEEKNLQNFVNQYNIDLSRAPKKIGVVMAGNIPAVGFHDYLCVLLSGCLLEAKLSSQDKYLLQVIHQLLVEIEPEFANRVQFTEQLNIKSLDAIIATGSDNSARYFEQYFSKVPNIIRKNRTSCAVLNGKEEAQDFENLGMDIFQYYGLGCRNVSKLYVPKDYDFTPLLDELCKHYTEVAYHTTYENNYTYNKSVYLVNKEEHLDTGFVLLRRSEELVSPIGVVYYEHYEDEITLKESLKNEEEKIQCIVSRNGEWKGSFAFGEAQQPKINDFADGVDTMQFLSEI